MVTNVYLDRLREMETRVHQDEFRKTRANAKIGKIFAKGNVTDTAVKSVNFNYVSFDSEMSAKILGLAHEDMRRAIRDKDIRYAITAASHYAHIGKADRPYVLNGVLKAYEGAMQNPNGGVKEFGYLVERFIKEHGGKATQQSHLEKSVATASVIGLLGGIFFLSSNVTGNSISNLSNTTSSWIGGVLFCVGLVSGFFWVKSRG